MINKKGFEFSFGWIFAVIVGAVIIFLAVYSATQLVKTERSVSDTEAGKQLGIILSPTETGIEEGKSSLIKFPLETRVFNTCDSSGNFGEQKISVATKSGIGQKWENPGVPSTFYNKYIFSSGVMEGKEIVVLSKPFLMPYKSGDILLLWPANEEYCFVNPPREIEEEVMNLKLKGVNVTSQIKECNRESKKVCFTNTGCDIDVNLEAGNVKKNKQTLYYEGDSGNALIYGAIFADPGIYECQIKRLMKRTGELAEIYRGKSESLAGKGCSSNLEPDLEIYANKTKNVNGSLELREINIMAKEIGRKNALLSCKLF